ncbi:MAG TPA: YidC/Oxa1 family membrane protein insertase [Candidatus Limnocylindrales bacterium]|nr:YidC/Oxa1 family membrane protein insertase [Candidatus Limnocylindrales bacterium]
MTEIWNTFLVHPLLSLLVAAYNVIPDFGWAIVVVTIGIRLLLYPLFVAQIRSQRAMQEIAPALSELRKKYGKDRQKMAEEQMKLYKERGANPAMGCLPLLVQLPILFAMYHAFIQAPDLTGAQLREVIWQFIPIPIGLEERLDTTAHWLPWIGECARPDGGVAQGLACPDSLGVLPVIAGATQLMASLMALPAQQPKTEDAQTKMMRSMTYYFPIITVVIAFQFPSGLAVYWVTTTIFQIFQQYFVTGWGQLKRWLPFLAHVPSPADRRLRQDQRAAIVEAEADMVAAGAVDETPAPDPSHHEPKEQGRDRRRRGRGKRRRSH